MISKKDFHKINNWLWELPKTFRSDMQVPARAYVSEKMLEESSKDESLEQLVNIAALPGIQKYALVMPDMHEGYGSPIGGIAAIRTSDGIISPGMTGFDINCGVRLLLSQVNQKEARPYLEQFAAEIQKNVPSGLGQGRKVKLDISSLDKILIGGVGRLVEQGYGEQRDIGFCESGGRLDWAEAGAVSGSAKLRGRDQLGTLGSGNHFLEVQRVETIFDREAAEVFGLFQDQVAVMVHTGSRGVGHQVCTDYLRIMVQAIEKYKIRIPDRQLACAPFNSLEGKRYFSAMAAAANFAWANRQMITFFIRKAWQSALGKTSSLNLLYDVAHNIIKKEFHQIDGKETELAVHRKGATRAFPPDNPEIPKEYAATGQPVLIPGSMGTASYVLAGQKEGEQSFYSSCHGAGRRMSRHQAKKTVSGRDVVEQLASKGIIVKCWSMIGIAEEAPLAYKDVDEVVEVVHKAGLSRKVARTVPIAVIKGE